MSTLQPAATPESVTHPAAPSLDRPLTHTAIPSAPTGPLAGSVLSAETWRQAFAVATGRSR